MESLSESNDRESDRPQLAEQNRDTEIPGQITEERSMSQISSPIPDEPPPSYSFLNQNEQAFNERLGAHHDHRNQFLVKPLDQAQYSNNQDPPPPYPFPEDEDQVPHRIPPSISPQSQPFEDGEPEHNFRSLTDLLGPTYDFSLKSNVLPCNPDYRITPLSSRASLSLPQPHNRIQCESSGPGCFYCCLPSFITSSWQTISFTKNRSENNLSLIYKPQAWVGACGKERLVDIYIPERNERIGWIKFKGDFSDGALIFNALSNELFVSRKIDFDNDGLALTIVNSVGLPVAVAQATSGVRSRGFTTWKTFRLGVSPITVRSDDTRAILLVAFTMWVINYKENTLRCRLLYIFIMILIGFGIGFGLPKILN